jgi:hypothetical protein
MTQKHNAEKKTLEMCRLSDDQLAKVVGGNHILPVWERGFHYPKYGPPKSIAQGEINSNSLDNRLPDSGGGIIS